jgi:hypothetical protein
MSWAFSTAPATLGQVPAQAGETTAPSGGAAARRPSRRGKRWRRALSAAALCAVLAAAATARLFIWPARGMPAQVNAIVMLDAPGYPVGIALRLARQHRAAFLIISLGTPDSGPRCPAPVPRVKVICFNPEPATTRGEAEFTGRLARRYRWRSVALVTITPQDSRARLRVERCFPGRVYVVTAPIALTSWPVQIAYEWGALVKALVIQRSC